VRAIANRRRSRVEGCFAILGEPQGDGNALDASAIDGFGVVAGDPGTARGQLQGHLEVAGNERRGRRDTHRGAVALVSPAAELRGGSRAPRASGGDVTEQGSGRIRPSGARHRSCHYPTIT